MLENAASDRPTWCSAIHKGATHAEALRINAATEQRGTQKALNAADMHPPIGAKPVGGVSHLILASTAICGHITPLSKPIALMPIFNPEWGATTPVSSTSKRCIPKSSPTISAATGPIIPK